MNVPETLSRYLASAYIRNLLTLLVLLLGIVYLFDTVELLRRAAKREDVPLGLVMQMGLLKLPEVGQVILPFTVLFAAMFTFWQLNRRHELVVIRAAGLSVWQFLAPLVTIGLLAGILHTTVINPVGSIFLGKFEEMERSHLSRESSYVTLFEEGIWLRQKDPGQEIIMHAEQINLKDWTLHNVILLFFGPDHSFIQRIDAPAAVLEQNRWSFSQADISQQGQPSRSVSGYTLPTSLTQEDIEESFASPETMSFWHLPGYIKVLESTGFDAARLRVHYHALLAQPLLFAAMVFLAAAVSLRPPRLRGNLTLVILGVFLGFLVFFLSSYLQALGASRQIPVFLAAWSPAVICMLAGISAMLNQEDG